MRKVLLLKVLEKLTLLENYSFVFIAGVSFFMRVFFVVPVISFFLIISGCSPELQKVTHIGKAPPLSNITDPRVEAHHSKITAPTPHVEKEECSENSLWKPGAKTFFKDNRASRVGDILTVKIDTTGESGEITFDSDSTRKSEPSAMISKYFGLERYIGKIPFFQTNRGPDASGNKQDLGNIDLVKGLSEPKFTSSGKTTRGGTVKFDIPVTIVQILPNGNLVVYGRQEIRVNNEVRDTVFKGVVRPSDIAADNTVDHKKVANARISFGGRGEGADLLAKPYGHRLAEIVSPF